MVNFLFTVKERWRNRKKTQKSLILVVNNNDKRK